MDSNTKMLVVGGAIVVGIGVILYLGRGPEPVSRPTTPPSSSATLAPTPTVAETAPAPAPSTGVVLVDKPVASASAQPETGAALSQSKRLDAAREALAAGDARQALLELHAYETFPEPRVHKEEATLLKIQTLPRVGRKTDALALALSTRDDHAYDAYQAQIQAIALDAGLTQPPAPP